MFKHQVSGLCLLLLLLLGRPGWSQDTNKEVNPPASHEQTKEQLDVHWLYGAYVPKYAPIVPLTNDQRLALFERQTFSTRGIYLKSAFLSLIDQAKGTPYDWGGGFGGYGHRLISNYAQSSIQNLFSAAGNAALRYEPRYDRCHCSGLGPRTKHALMRNFLTYDRTEQELHPQFALYAGALGAGMLSSVWKPTHQPGTNGYHSVLTQAGFGMLSNWVGEFGPEIGSKLTKHKPESSISNRLERSHQ